MDKSLNINPKYQVIYLNKCTSTNALLKENKYSYNTILITKRQTNGVGRMNRTFISNKPSGLYMSILFNEKDIKDINTLTCLVGVGVSTAIDEVTNASTKIKWVNDIYLENKKICGILVEKSKDKVIVGIGINIKKQKFPKELENKASTIEDLTNKIVSKKLLAELIINNIDKLLLSNDYMNEYINRSLIIGKEVKLLFDNEEINVKVLNINESGNLVVLHDGITKTINSGEVIRTII